MDFQRIYESVLRELLDDFYGREQRQAWKYAKRKHDDTGALRKASKLPYFVHPESAAKLLKDEGADDVEVVASLCHDLVEDAGATFEDIEEKFGPRVAGIVAEVTNDDRMLKSIGKENYMNQKLIGMSDEALDVKLADMVNNYFDSPGQSQRERLEKNFEFLVKNRELAGLQRRLVDMIISAGELPT